MSIGIALVLAALMAAIAMAAIEFLTPRAIIWLGNQDKWWSPFRTLPPPGEMYILVRGDPDGPFHDILESVIGWTYDKASHTFLENPADTGVREDYLGELGIAWVGFNKYFLWREVRYDKWEKEADPSTNWKIVSKSRGVKGAPGNTPSIFFRYNMAAEIRAAETIGNFPVDGVVVFTVQVENPVQAFFFAGGWEAQTNAAVQGVFREYVSTKTIEDLRLEQRRGANTLVESIKNLAHDLRPLFGISVVDARFVNFDLVTGEAEMSRAVKAKEIARLEAEANLITADNEAAQEISRARGKSEAKERLNRADEDRLQRVLLPAAATEESSRVFRSDREAAAYENNTTIKTWVNGGGVVIPGGD